MSGIGSYDCMTFALWAVLLLYNTYMLGYTGAEKIIKHNIFRLNII